MSSILTNLSSLTALQNLRSMQHDLSTVQQRISTGFKVSSAADNASTWSMAETMKSDQGVMSTIIDSLGVGSQIISVAMAGVDNAITVMNQIKDVIAQSAQPGADNSKLAGYLVDLSAQLRSIISSSTFSGVNLLDGSLTSFNVPSGYVDGRGGTSTLSTINLSPEPLFKLSYQDKTYTVNGQDIVYHFSYPTGILDTGPDSAFPDTISNGGGPVPGPFIENGVLRALEYHYYANFADIADYNGNQAAVIFASDFLGSNWVMSGLSAADYAISKLTEYGANLGSVKSTIDSQREFMSTMNDAMTTGIGSLVNADMNEESTRLQALQTQQQLAVQSLSIANQNNQIVLKLFQ